MLKQLSRLKRTRSLVIIIFAVLLGLSLLLFYAPGRSNTAASPVRSSEVLAEVGDGEITVGDLNVRREEAQLRMQQMQSQFGGQFNLPTPTARQLLDGMIRERVMAQEAARLGLAPSDAEVAEFIRKNLVDASGKFIGFPRYKEIAISRAGSVEDFERQIRDSIAAQKLQAFVTAGVNVSEQEVQDDYKRRNTTFELAYVPVTADQLATKINPNDQEVQAYYDGRKTDFRILEPQKKIRYLFIDQAKVGEKLQIPDADLQARYNQLTPEQKQSGVKVQQIILRVARPDLDEQVRQKAEELVQKARTSATDGKTNEATFAELARGNSEDPNTAKNGGALSGIVRRNPNKPDDPLQRTLTMEVGQVSEPIKYGNAYYIFRRGEAVPKTFEDAKPELLVSMRNTRAYAAAAGIAARAAEQLKETKDFQAVAQNLAGEANMNPAEMVRETDYVKPGDDVPNIGSSPQFEGAIAGLNDANQIGDRVSIKGGFAIPMLIDKRDPRIPELSEVRDRVVQRVREEAAKARLEQTAGDLAANANSVNDLRAAAERLGLEVKTAKDYKLGTPLGEAGTSPAADAAIYNLQIGQATKTPIKISDTQVVIGATKRTEADLAEFAKERDSLMQSALTAKRNEVFEEYIVTAQAKMQRGGDVEIRKDVLAKVSEDDAPPFAAPAGGRFPVQRLPIPPSE